jgi:hypothetical protein
MDNQSGLAAATIPNGLRFVKTGHPSKRARRLFRKMMKMYSAVAPFRMAPFRKAESIRQNALATVSQNEEWRYIGGNAIPNGFVS